jgi:hypothetical protein
MILGGSRWSVALAEALKKMDLPVIIADPNHGHLRAAREAGIETWFGDILSEAAEHRLELAAYEKLICATDDDAYNTLVATDLGPEFGRQNVFQLKRVKDNSKRHALPVTLGGLPFGDDLTFFEANAKCAAGWELRLTSLTDTFGPEDWAQANSQAVALIEISSSGALRVLGSQDAPRAGCQLIHLCPSDA